MKLKFSGVLLVAAISISCQDGTDGYNTIVSTAIEPNGDSCPSGGIKINYGLDLNRNSELEEEEIQNFEIVCHGSGGNLVLDNLTRLELGAINDASCGPEWYMSGWPSFLYPDFNKHDYDGVSKILFVPTLMSYEGENNVVTVELFNVTDNLSIENSQVQLHPGEENYIFKYSEDIYDFLPDHAVTLGIRMKSSDGCGGTGVRSYLYILRE